MILIIFLKIALIWAGLSLLLTPFLTFLLRRFLNKIENEGMIYRRLQNIKQGKL